MRNVSIGHKIFQKNLSTFCSVLFIERKCDLICTALGIFLMPLQCSMHAKDPQWQTALTSIHMQRQKTWSSKKFVLLLWLIWQQDVQSSAAAAAADVGHLISFAKKLDQNSFDLAGILKVEIKNAKTRNVMGFLKIKAKKCRFVLKLLHFLQKKIDQNIVFWQKRLFVGKIGENRRKIVIITLAPVKRYFLGDTVRANVNVN
jgi:hypothetical protein